MEHNIIRFAKPVALSAICFISLLYLTKSMSTSLFISLIPLLLGWLGIMEGFAYGIATLIFVTAVAWTAMPSGIKSVIADNASRAADEVKREMKTQ